MSGLEVVEALWRLHEALNPPAEQNVAQRFAPGATVDTGRFQCFAPSYTVHSLDEHIRMTRPGSNPPNAEGVIFPPIGVE
jgi:hypothetical protein